MVSEGDSARFWYTVSMPLSRASIGERKCTTSPSSRISPKSGMHGPGQGLDHGRLAGAVVADHGQDLAGQKVEIGVVDGRDTTEALDQAPGLEDGFRAHADTFRIHWSSATATMISTPDRELLPEHVEAGERHARSEDADDERADQGPDDRPAAAEETRAADHHGRDAVEVGVLAARRADGADPADQHPARDGRDRAGQDVDLQQDLLGVDAREAGRFGSSPTA